MLRVDSRRRSRLERRISRRVDCLGLGIGRAVGVEESVGMLFPSGVGSSWKSHHMAWSPAQCGIKATLLEPM
jgi:hypothetical protein